MTVQTAEAAREKWCPFVRIGQQGGTSVNRGAGDGKGGAYDFADMTRCIADECMAWQWSSPTDPGSEPTIGYCGLAMTRR